MKKQVLFTILAMLVSVSAFSHDIAVKNADGVTIYYNYMNNGTELEVTYRGSSYDEYSNEYQGNVVIPEEVSYSGKTYPVTSIGSGAFSNCSGLTSITIPNSVTSIGNEAFYFCPGLTSVTIPNSVTSIGVGAFAACPGLTSIKVKEGNPKYDSRNNCNAIIETETNALIVGCQNTIIPNSVTSIGGGAFEYCSRLTSVTIPNSVTSIGWSAFYQCSGLTSITIPNSVTSIGVSTFWGCSSLTSVTIPNSVTSIGGYAFEGCSGLKKVIVKDIAAWCGIKFNSNPLFYAKHLYSDEDTEITNLIIPNSVTSIGNAAFNGCSGLTSVTIPNSVTSVGDYAFEGCTGLKNLTIHNNRPPVVDKYLTSQEVYDSCVLYVPEGSENAYYVANGWKYFKNIQAIGAVEKVPQDVNGDGIVDTQDVLEIYKYMQEH